jgi:NAD(P)-dependent dehydrogenase (short-subunit alcohol dehydrogenase family)
MDLLDLEALENAAHVALAATDGRLDVLVNNAIYAGPGNDRLFGEVDRRDIINRVTGNLTAQLLFTQTILNAMLRQDEIAGLRGTIVNITSGAGQHTPPAPVGKGGWPLTYAATKAGFHRMADMLALEYGPVGIRACNINPGFIATERVLASETLKFVAEQGAAPSVVGDAVLRFLSDLSLKNGVYLQAQ